MAEEQSQEREAQQPGDFKLSLKEKTRIRNWLQNKWTGTKVCPISGDNKWIIADYLVQPNVVIHRMIGVGGPGIPMVMVICDGCGYTMYFNAVLTGVLEDSNGDS